MRRTLLCLSTTLLVCIAWASPALANHVSCGDVLIQDTTLDSDLVCPGDALRIGADGVTLDLAGHEIRGPGGVTGAVAVDNHRFTPEDPRAFNDMTVEHGRISGFGLAIRVEDSTGGRISDLKSDGLWLRRVDGYEVRRNVLSAGSIVLIESDSNLVQGNRIDDGVIQLIVGNQNVVDRNRVSFTQSGITDLIRISAPTTTVTRNVTRGGGISLQGNANGSVVDGNRVVDALVGIWVTSVSEATVSGNRVTDSVEDGIRVAFSHFQNDVVERNIVLRNGDDGIDIDSIPTSVTRNKASRNGDLGIEAVAGTTDGGGNKARHNGNPAQCVGVSCN